MFGITLLVSIEVISHFLLFLGWVKKLLQCVVARIQLGWMEDLWLLGETFEHAKNQRPFKGSLPSIQGEEFAFVIGEIQ